VTSTVGSVSRLSESAGFLRRRTRTPAILTLDEPPGPVTIDGGTLLVRGWAVHRASRDPGEVQVVIDGERFSARRTVRPDVAQHLELDPALAVGFTAAIDRRRLAHRGHVRVEATFERAASLKTPDINFEHLAGDPVPVEEVGTCPVCGDAERQIEGSSDGLRMARCATCAVVYTVDRPTPGFLAARYSAAYFADEYLPALEAEADAMATHWSMLLDLLEPHRGAASRLFEIGTGAGRFLRAARQRGWDGRGVDINAAAVEYGRREYELDLVAAPADTEINPTAGYDAVVSEMSLEHLPDPHAVVARAAAALRPGGVLMIFTVCADGDSFTSLGMASPLVGPAEHLFLFSQSSLERLVTDAGLEPLLFWTDEAGDSIGVLARHP